MVQGPLSCSCFEFAFFTGMSLLSVDRDNGIAVAWNNLLDHDLDEVLRAQLAVRFTESCPLPSYYILCLHIQDIWSCCHLRMTTRQTCQWLHWKASKPPFLFQTSSSFNTSSSLHLLKCQLFSSLSYYMSLNPLPVSPYIPRIWKLFQTAFSVRSFRTRQRASRFSAPPSFVRLWKSDSVM